MTEYKLKDLKLNGIPLTSLYYINVSPTIIMYYSPNSFYSEEVSGCEFSAVEWTGSSSTDEGYFMDSNTMVQILCTGSIYWDGLRHLYFGDKQTDNVGYLFCTDPNDIIIIMKALLKLEKRYCPKYGLPKRRSK